MLSRVDDDLVVDGRLVKNPRGDELNDLQVRAIAARIREELRKVGKRTPTERRALTDQVTWFMDCLIGETHFGPGSPEEFTRHNGNPSRHFLEAYEHWKITARTSFLGRAAHLVFDCRYKGTSWTQHRSIRKGVTPYRGALDNEEDFKKGLEMLDDEWSLIYPKGRKY